MNREQEKNNSLIKVEDNSLKEIGKRAMPKVADGIKRLGKIAGWGSLAFVGLGAFTVGSVPIATIRRNYSFGIRF